MSHHVDPMVFPLLFPLGDLEWSTSYNKNPNEKKKCFNEKTKYLNEKNKYPDKKNKCPNEKKKHDNEKTCLTILQYYLYRLSYRQKNFSPILFGGRLTQQYFLHAYVMIESNRMNYFRNHQDKLRVACYQGLLDHVKCSATNVSKNFETKERLGNLFILPSTYIGSPKYMQQYYQDVMAIMRHTGKPDLFITMTCNQKWKELKEILKNFQKEQLGMIFLTLQFDYFMQNLKCC